MAATAVDTLSIAKRLQAAGFTPSQAEVVTAVVSEAAIRPRASW